MGYGVHMSIELDGRGVVAKAGGPERGRARQAILDAVCGLLEHGAPAALVVADVMRANGVSRQTFYKHFSDLPAAVRAAAVARIQDSFTRIPPVALGQSWTVFARGTFEVLLTDLADHASFYRAALALAAPGLMAELVGYLAERILNVSPLGPIIRRCAGPQTPEQHAQFLGAGTVWLVCRWLESSADPRPEVDSMAETLIDLILSSSGATSEEIAAARASDLPRQPHARMS